MSNRLESHFSTPWEGSEKQCNSEIRTLDFDHIRSKFILVNPINVHESPPPFYRFHFEETKPRRFSIQRFKIFLNLFVHFGKKRNETKQAGVEPKVIVSKKKIIAIRYWRRKKSNKILMKFVSHLILCVIFELYSNSIISSFFVSLLELRVEKRTTNYGITERKTDDR